MPRRPTLPKIRRSRPQLLLAVLGVALLGVGVSVTTVASLKEWTPPPELALVRGADGQLVAQVQLGSAGPTGSHRRRPVDLGIPLGADRRGTAGRPPGQGRRRGHKRSAGREQAGATPGRQLTRPRVAPPGRRRNPRRPRPARRRTGAGPRRARPGSRDWAPPAPGEPVRAVSQPGPAA